MTRKELNEFLTAEVYKDAERPNGLRKYFSRLYTRNFVPSRRAVYLVRRMQYYSTQGFIERQYAHVLERKIWSEFSCFISAKARIGKGFHLPHPTGVVIGVASTLGENVSVYQGVTIGGGNLGDAKKGNQPTIGNNVICFADCKVLGKIHVADNCVLAAGSIVLKDTEESGVYVGAPAKRVK